MEAKLKEYRALRRRKELIDNAKERLENTKQKLSSFFVPKFFRDMDREKKDDEVLLLEDEEPQKITEKPTLQIEESYEVEAEVSELESLEEEKQESWRYFTVKWTVYTITWLTLYIFFLKEGFGAVFFVISLLIGICLNTRTRRRKAGPIHTGMAADGFPGGKAPHDRTLSLLDQGCGGDELSGEPVARRAFPRARPLASLRPAAAITV